MEIKLALYAGEEDFNGIRYHEDRFTVIINGDIQRGEHMPLDEALSVVKEHVETWHLETLRQWLKNNDSNGCYDDSGECGTLTKDAAIEIIINQLEQEWKS
jgi:hypothetical protein